MDKRIEPGYCWISGKPTHEIISHFSGDHPLAGHVERIGEVIPEATRMTLLLTTGDHFAITVLKDHVNELNLNEVWKLIQQGQIHSFEHTKSSTPEKSLQAHKEQMKMLSNPPIGVLCVERHYECTSRTITDQNQKAVIEH